MTAEEMLEYYEFNPFCHTFQERLNLTYGRFNWGGYFPFLKCPYILDEEDSQGILEQCVALEKGWA